MAERTKFTGYLFFSVLKYTIGLRVNGELEHLGLDLHEHDNQAYPEFSGVSDELLTARV